MVVFPQSLVVLQNVPGNALQMPSSQNELVKHGLLPGHVPPLIILQTPASQVKFLAKSQTFPELLVLGLPPPGVLVAALLEPLPVLVFTFWQLASLSDFYKK